MQKAPLIAVGIALLALLALGSSLVVVNTRAFTSRDLLSDAADHAAQLHALPTSPPINLITNVQKRPSVALGAGRELRIEYFGAVAGGALENGSATPLSIAAGDTDEDGVPDLVSGYASDDANRLVVHRGNVDAIYPNTPEANDRKARGEFTDAPFLSPARVIELPARPDFIGAGDFDADGRIDVVIAAQGGTQLYWLAGDGHGAFGPVQAVELRGNVTAMTVGEINRRDGLADVIVGIEDVSKTTNSSLKLLVFEGPEGAFIHEPETIPISASATSLALGQFDGSYERDLAAAAGTNLFIVHGRDRRLSVSEAERAKVGPADVDTHEMSFSIRSLAIGNFTQTDQDQIAALSEDGAVHVLDRNAKETAPPMPVLSAPVRDELPNKDSTPSGAGPILIRAQISSGEMDDVVVVDRTSRRLHILTHGFNSTESSLVDDLSTLDVEGDPVRALPMRLNVDALDDLVVLKSGGVSPLAVVTTVPLRTFTVNSTASGSDINPGNGICETTVGGGRCSLKAAIQEANASLGADTINFSVSSCVLTGGESSAQINETVTIDGGDGVDLSGWNLSFAGASGKSVVRNVLVRKGTNDNGGNVTFANSGENTVEGCVIGLDLGQAQLNNGGGITLGNSLNPTNNNKIGGKADPAGNTIAGGVGDFGASGGNEVAGNYLGTDGSGTNWLTFTGISLRGSDNVVGGDSAGARNVVTGGLSIGEAGLVQGNYLGVNANGDGFTFVGGAVFVLGPHVDVGGTAPELGNVIATGGSSNGGAIEISAAAPDTYVQGNFIGTDKTGTRRLVTGVANGIKILQSAQNVVGGSSAGARNVIIAGDSTIGASNTSDGIVIFGPNAVNNVIVGNFIGVDASGVNALGGGMYGIEFTTSGGAAPTNNRIGGTIAAEGNVIGGFKQGGMYVRGSGNTVQNNFIGLATTGRSLPNTGTGIFINGDNNLIGGSEGGGNTIAFNGGSGISAGGVGNALRRNSIFSNNGGGISVGSSPSPPSPSLFVDGSGAAAATISGVANTVYQIEFFSNTTCGSGGFGQGQTFLSQVNVTTNASGTATIPNVPQAARLTATATRPDNTTSEFSRCVTPTNLPPQIGLDKTTLNYTVTSDGSNPPNQTVTLTNSGNGTLNWTAGASTNKGGAWLTVAPTSGSLAANQSITLTASVDASALDTDSFTGAITVSSTNAGNTPQKINVNLTVDLGADSLAILNPKINSIDASQGSFDDSVDFQCDVQYRLVGDRLGGTIALFGYDVSTPSISPPALALTTEFVSRTLTTKTKSNLHVKFPLPAGSNQPRKVRIVAVLTDSTTPSPRVLATQLVEFGSRNYLKINKVEVESVQVYPIPSTTGPPIYNFQPVVMRCDLIYGLSGPAGGTIDIKVSEGVGTPVTNVTLNVAAGGSQSVAPSFSYAPGVSPLTSSQAVSVDLRDSNGALITHREFRFGFRVKPPSGNYDFQNTHSGSPSGRESAEGAAITQTAGVAAPALTDLVAPGSSTGNTFTTETVDGTARPVLRFPTNNGLALSPTTGTIPNNVYTVVMLFKFDEANKTRRILDFKNGASDNGLYASADNRLRFNPSANGTSSFFGAGSYVQIALTRDANGITTGYVNGTQQFQFTDASNDAVIDPNNTLRFFQDNLSGVNTGEASAGSIARLRLYDRALGASEIAALDRAPSSVKFSSATYSVGETAGSATITVTRTGATAMPASVGFVTSDQTAKQGVDYTFASGTLSFAPGETSKVFQVPIIDNRVIDFDRNLVLFLINPSGVSLDVQSSAVLTISDNDTLASIAQKRAPFDFDGDYKSDVAVFRPSNGNWYVNRSRDGFYGQNFGTNTDKLAPADYDGDGKTDVAVYRPSTGVFFIYNSSNGSDGSGYWGLAEDIPCPGDFDGDGKADIAIFRPSTGTFWIRQSGSGNAPLAVQYGASGDQPVIGDYDGDGKSDIAVYRPSTGVWYLHRSTAGDTAVQFGIASDKAVPADFDGDGKTDVAVYRTQTGLWFVVNSTGGYTSYQFGYPTDIPAPGDYDGDGKTDMSIFRPSPTTSADPQPLLLRQEESPNFWVNGTTSGVRVTGWGANGDVPIANAYVR